MNCTRQNFFFAALLLGVFVSYRELLNHHICSFFIRKTTTEMTRKVLKDDVVVAGRGPSLLLLLSIQAPCVSEVLVSALLLMMILVIAQSPEVTWCDCELKCGPIGQLKGVTTTP